MAPGERGTREKAPKEVRNMQELLEHYRQFCGINSVYISFGEVLVFSGIFLGTGYKSLWQPC